MAKVWRTDLPEQFNRRIEDGSLVLWRPDLTLWINVWNNDQRLGVDELLARVLKSASADRSDEQLVRSGGIAHLSYELIENDADNSDHSINGYIFSNVGYVQISAYYDTPEARSLGYQVINAVCPSG